MDRKQSLDLVISGVAQNLFDGSDDESSPLKRPRVSSDDSSASASWSPKELLSPVVGEQIANQALWDGGSIYKGTHRIVWEWLSEGRKVLRRQLLDGVGKLDSVEDLPAVADFEWVDGKWAPVTFKWFMHGSPGRRGDNLPDAQAIYPPNNTHTFFWTDVRPFKKIGASKIMTLDFARDYLMIDLAKNPLWEGNLYFTVKGRDFAFQAHGDGMVVILSNNPGTWDLESLEDAPAEVIYMNGVLESKKWVRDGEIHRDSVAGPAYVERRPDGGFDKRYYVDGQELPAKN